MLKFKDLVPFLDRRGLPLGAKAANFILHVYVALCYIDVRPCQLNRNM